MIVIPALTVRMVTFTFCLLQILGGAGQRGEGVIRQPKLQSKVGKVGKGGGGGTFLAAVGVNWA